MDPVTATPSTSSTIDYSLIELIEIIYLTGICSISGWEFLLNNLKKIILDEQDVLVNVFFTLSNAVSNFLLDENSQPNYIKIKEMKLTLEEMLQYFSEQISQENLHAKSINFDCIKRFKELIQETEKIELININDSDTDVDDDDDVVKKAFSTAFASKKSTTHTKFEQSFHLLSNEEKQWIKTTGEEGKYLIEIKVTDTKDLKKIPSDEWWKKVCKKAVFLASSSSDPLYVATNKILKDAFYQINKTKNKCKGKYSVNSKFKPY